MYLIENGNTGEVVAMEKDEFSALKQMQVLADNSKGVVFLLYDPYGVQIRHYGKKEEEEAS